MGGGRSDALRSRSRRDRGAIRPASAGPRAFPGPSSPAAMSLLAFLMLLLVAGVCGSIGRSIAGYSHTGCFTSVALGFIGALLGLWLARALHLPELFAV